MSHAKIRVVSGNFVTARPVGVIDGVDYQHAGAVRKIDTDSILRTLEQESIVLLSPLGFSPTGEAFNLPMEELARSEEHTSELQSRGHIVCRLLLEKQKIPSSS